MKSVSSFTIISLFFMACGGNSTTEGDTGLDTGIPDGDATADTGPLDALDDVPDDVPADVSTDVPEEVTGSPHMLYNTIRSTSTTLINMDTRAVVHTWNRSSRVANCVYLLENGNILRPGELFGSPLHGGAGGGIIEEVDWDNELVWSFTYSGTTYLLHHDVKRMPNGNTLAIAWEVKSSTEAVQAGRDSSVEMWPDHIIEIEPTGPTSGNIVWEWHAWDHLIQDHDPARDNYGVVADHPELIDVNLGYIMSGGPGGGGDWLHLNSVDYNADLDQVMVSSHTLDEIWIIDHSTTTAEAAGHTGGASGMGGDLIYRWGNPPNYGAAGSERLWVVHCAKWITAGLPGEGHVMLFNNGDGRPGGNYSTAEEIETPGDGMGGYLMSGGVFGPTDLFWSYTASPATSFYSSHIGSAQRLASGNTFLCEGTTGDVLEVTSAGETVWSHSIGDESARAYRYEPDYPGLARLYE